MEAEETEDIIVGAWAKDDGDLEKGGNGGDLKYILKVEVTRLNERCKSLVRKRSGFGTLIHVPLRKVGKTRFGMMEKKSFFFLCQIWDV